MSLGAVGSATARIYSQRACFDFTTDWIGQRRARAENRPKS
jgi:aminoglycoside N3'-acetyltransferase